MSARPFSTPKPHSSPPDKELFVTYSITFYAGPIDGFETQRPSIPSILFLPGRASVLASHDILSEQWTPGAAGYKLTRLVDQAAMYSFYGWHQPIYKLSV